MEKPWSSAQTDQMTGVFDVCEVNVTCKSPSSSDYWKQAKEVSDT